MPPPAEIQCPTCRRRGNWFDSTFGPFCSHRCRLIDLGKWLGEEHLIAEPLPPGVALESEERIARGTENEE